MMEHIVLSTSDNMDLEGMSCETQLCTIFHKLARTAEAKKTTHAVVLDFKKTFDKVPHTLLMQKLKQIPDIRS